MPPLVRLSGELQAMESTLRQWRSELGGAHSLAGLTASAASLMGTSSAAPGLSTSLGAGSTGFVGMGSGLGLGVGSGRDAFGPPKNADPTTGSQAQSPAPAPAPAPAPSQSHSDANEAAHPPREASPPLSSTEAAGDPLNPSRFLGSGAVRLPHLSMPMSTPPTQTSLAQLIHGIVVLRADLHMHSNIDELDAVRVFSVFLNIIQSEEAGALPKGLALASLQRLLLSNTLQPTAPRASQAMSNIVDAVVNCRFEQTDNGADEIALMWILETIVALVTCNASALLTEDHVWDLFLTVFDVSIEVSHADMLRSLATRTAGNLVQHLFRLAFSPSAAASNTDAVPNATNAAHARQDRDHRDVALRIFAFLASRSDPHSRFSSEVPLLAMDERLVSLHLLTMATEATLVLNEGTKQVVLLLQRDEAIFDIVKDELMCYLVQTAQTAGRGPGPSASSGKSSAGSGKRVREGTRTNRRSSHRVHAGVGRTATAAVAAAAAASRSRSSSLTPGGATSGADGSQSRRSSVERNVGPGGPMSTGPHRGYEDFRSPIVVLSAALRLAQIFFSISNTRRHLKPQLEAFLNAVVLRVMEGKSSSPQESVLVMEFLLELLADPTLAIDLFIAYDCDTEHTDLFENLMTYLSRLSFPNRMGSPDTKQILSVRCIQYVLRAIAERCDLSIDASALLNVPRGAETPLESGEEGEGKGETQRPPTEDIEADSQMHYPSGALWNRKLQKRALQRCANEFSKKPKRGLKALVELGVLSDDPFDPVAIAHFLRFTPTLDKTAIGVFLGSDEELNQATLREFTRTFDMHGQTLLESLRMFLESFRLPKEAQQIDRVLQAFAEVAFEESSEKGLFATADAAYIFSFSIIMLNTDLHNPNIRPEKKMTLEAYIKNNTNYGQDVSGDLDLPPEFIEAVYEEIRDREINTMIEGTVLTKEVSGDHWRDLLRMNEARAPHERKLTTHAALSVRPVLACDPPEDWSGPPYVAASAGQRAARVAAKEGTLIHVGSYDRHMFAIMWKAAIAALTIIFDSGSAVHQPGVLRDALDGFLLCAKIAAHFEFTDVLDSVTVSLCKFTTLLAYGSGGEDGAYAVAEVAGNGSSSPRSSSLSESGVAAGAPGSATATLSEETTAGPSSRLARISASSRDQRTPAAALLKRFGENSKAQMALIFAFNIARRFGSQLRLAWRHLVYCILRLCDMRLIPHQLVQESADPVLDIVSRVRLHKAIAQQCVRESEARTRRERERSEAKAGWLASWLFGGDSSSTNPVDAEHQALLAASAVAESSIAHFLVMAQSDKTSLETPPRGSGAAAMNPLSPSSTASSPTYFTSDSADRGRGDALRNARQCVEACELQDIVDDSRHLSDDSILSFVNALVLTTGGVPVARTERPGVDDAPESTGDGQGAPEANEGADGEVGEDRDLAAHSGEPEAVVIMDAAARRDFGVDGLAPPSYSSMIFCLHLLTEVVLRNRDRAGRLWPVVQDHYLSILQDSERPTFEGEKAAVGLLRIGMRCLHRPELAKPIASLMRRLLRVPPAVSPGLGGMVSQCLLEVVRSGRALIPVGSPRESLDAGRMVEAGEAAAPAFGWDEFFLLLEECSAHASSLARGFEVLRLTVLGPHTRDSVPVDVCKVCAEYVVAKWPEAQAHGRELGALDLTFSLALRLEARRDEPGVILSEWVPVLRELAHVVQSPELRENTRVHALRLLRNAMEEGSVRETVTSLEWVEVFDTVVFPTCNFAIQNRNVHVALEVQSLLGSCVLSHAGVLAQLPAESLDGLWMRVLGFEVCLHC